VRIDIQPLTIEDLMDIKITFEIGLLNENIKPIRLSFNISTIIHPCEFTVLEKPEILPMQAEPFSGPV
jgi:hypothetical protein